MKTFEEALKYSCADASEAGAEEAMMENATRYREIIGEIQDSKQFQAMVEGMLNMAGQIGPENVIASAFINGLITGMEMEKREGETVSFAEEVEKP